MVSLSQKIAIRKYKAEVLDGGDVDRAQSFCNLVGKTYNWPCAQQGRRLFDEALETEAAPQCDDAADEVVVAATSEFDFVVGSCAELTEALSCDTIFAQNLCPATCDACAEQASAHPQRALTSGKCMDQ